MKRSIKTRIQVTVEVDGANYDEQATLEQIHNQQSHEASNLVFRSIAANKNARIVGEPKVLTITTFPDDQ